MVLENLLEVVPVSRVNSIFASAPELGNTRSTEFPSESKFDDVPPFKSLFRLEIKSSIISKTEVLAAPEPMFPKISCPEKFCFTWRLGETGTSLVKAEPTYETLPLLSITKGFFLPDTPPNKLFPKLSFWFAISNISFLSICAS